MQEVDKKITPHTIGHTINQSLKVVEEGEMRKDCRSDDIYITLEFQKLNDIEPMPVGRDNLAPVEKSKLRIKHSYLEPP